MRGANYREEVRYEPQYRQVRGWRFSLMMENGAFLIGKGISGAFRAGARANI